MSRLRPPLMRPTPSLLATVALLAIGLIPTSGDGAVRAVLRTLHTMGLTRSEGTAPSGGYYEGLIDGIAEERDELSLRLLGKPPEWTPFTEAGATRYLDDFLQFELLPGVDTTAFGARFTTNSRGFRDREIASAKPDGLFRIVLLGSSIDMGWGVATDDTYENRLEDWLNTQAARRNLPRRFEVVNLAMAAYSPMHRLESYVRKARELEPDLVLYAATRLDPRLLELHILWLVERRIEPRYDFVRSGMARAYLDPERVARQRDGRLQYRDLLIKRLTPELPALEADAMGELARLCRRDGVPLAVLIIPRATEDDRPDQRGPDVRRINDTARSLGLPVLDITSAFDAEDPGTLEIAPWDDHPNGLGHHLLFLELARDLMAQPDLVRLMFDAPTEDPSAPTKPHP